MGKTNTLWDSIKRVVIVFPYREDGYYRQFRSELDRMLNDSKVDKLEIIVTLPSTVKKEDLPAHRLIHFISQKDFNLFGKIKGDALFSVLSKEYDALLNFQDDNEKLDKTLREMKVQYRIGINSPLSGFDIDLKGKEMDPQELVNFAKDTLSKLSI